MKFNVHAGHNPDGKVACGAVGLIKESTQARKVKNYVIKYLKAAGHTVYDCTCSNGISQSDVLKKIINKCNEHAVKLDISIHFNSGACDKNGNKKTTGTEVLVYSLASASYTTAGNIAEQISKLGLKNRGVKVRPDLMVLNSTKADALLVECCFVDDKDDINCYNAKSMAQAIVKGILSSYTFKVKTTKKGVYLRSKAGSDVEKTSRLAKGTEVEISKVDIKKDIVYGYIKKYNKWISLVNTKIV